MSSNQTVAMVGFSRECDRCFAPIACIAFKAEHAEYDELPGGGIRHKVAGYLVTPQGATYCKLCADRGIRSCHECGCTDEEGCPEGCYWVGDNLCSMCEIGKEYE